jgi:hypothetical protein
MYRIIVYILVLFLCVNRCSGITNENENKKNGFKCILEFDGICIDVKDGACGAALTVAIGVFTYIDEKRFHQAVDKVLETYNKSPKSIATLGLLLSIAALKDSLNDYEKIALYDEQIKDAFRDKDEDSRDKRLAFIKALLKADHKRQFTMGVIKGLFTMTFGVTAYYTTVNWLFWPMAGAGTIGGFATLGNVYNYQQFSMLTTKLEQDGHLNS